VKPVIFLGKKNMVEEKENVGTASFGCPAKAKPSASVGTDAFVRPAGKARVRKRYEIRPLGKKKCAEP